MPDGSPSLKLSMVSAITEVSAADWDACAGDNPFLSHAFLSASHAAHAESRVALVAASTRQICTSTCDALIVWAFGAVAVTTPVTWPVGAGD